MASNVPLTGGYDCKFVDTPPDKLICQICLLVARISHQMPCCGRIYCKACLDTHKRLSNTCPNCRKTRRSFPDTRGEQEIKALQVKCNNDENGCGWKGELRSLDNHLTTCGYALLRCTNKCTNNKQEVYVLRRDMNNHLKHKCRNRQYQCPHCKDTRRYCEITTTHLEVCPNLKISCPNVGCSASGLRCKILDHRTKCLFEKVPCKYAEIGCEEKLLRKDLQQHENDYMLHLQLAVDTVNTMREEQREMKDNIAHTQASPCVFKMPKFNQYKTLVQEWYSPPFYIHPGSYKMCIIVVADGDDAEGTHVSVYACLVQGKNDDNLSWPFRGEVTITMLNQQADENHCTYTIMYPEDMDDESNRRVVDSGMSEGYGKEHFIAHDQLGHDAANNCQYLKDDCLYFRIAAKAADPVKPWLTCTN